MEAGLPDVIDLSLAELTEADELIVWATRSLVEDRSSIPTVKAEFRRACGLIVGEACAHALLRLLEGIGNGARRDLFVHQPHCPCVGIDERLILTLIARLQDRDAARAKGLVQWLVPANHVARVMEDAGALGDLLAARCLTLTAHEHELPAMPPPAPGEPRLTVV
jgi:hypothetical protein